MSRIAAAWFLCLCFVATLSVSFGGDFLTCSSDQTEVKTPYIFVNSKEYGDCAGLIGAIINWYNDTYRSECQRWMGGAKPARVENAYITECTAFSNETLKYRAEVCCPGATTVKRCFTCANATDHYSCNYHGTVETCSAGQECGTVFNYYGSRGRYCSRKISKGCMAAQTCQALTDRYPSTCKNYIDNPQCGYCYAGDNYGNRFTPGSNSYRYCGERETTACSSYPCRYGRCSTNSTVGKGYYCSCYGYSWLNADGHCTDTMCYTKRPCQNSGSCYHLSSPSPYYKCCCKQGFKGYNCSEIVAPGCSSNPGYCMNGGTCYDYGSGTYLCNCPSGWVGERCEKFGNLTCSRISYTLSSTTTSTRNCSSIVSPWSTSTFINGCAYRMRRPGGPVFKNGVHGYVANVESMATSSCINRGNCKSYSITACCPSCLSAPCLNGGWCVQKQNHEYVCKCRWGYEGKNCENKVSMCMTAGDPHYQTFDGQWLHFQGTCKYTMVEPSQDIPRLENFQVLTKNEQRHGNTRVSYPKYLEVNVFGYSVRLGRNNVVTVNGASITPDVDFGGFELTQNGQFIRMETNFSLVVEFDGYWTGIIKLPAAYSDKVGGLCGNYDGIAENDLTTKSGQDVSGSATMSSDIGNSYYVGDIEDSACPKKDIVDPVCDPNNKQLAESDAHCGVIKSTAGPFGACVSTNPKIAESFFGNCVYDTCANPVKESSCAAILAFVVHCSNKGLSPRTTWRSDINCPLDCPADMTYQAVTSACHVTCKNPLAETECKLPNTEACKCEEGKVFHQNSCQSPSVCGCTDSEGSSYPIGNWWLESGCSNRYMCVLNTTTGWGKITKSSYSCAYNEECREEDGISTCIKTTVDGNWGEWSGWSECTEPCGKGVQIRNRKCDNPQPASGGSPCPGSSGARRECVCSPFELEDCKRCNLTVNPGGYFADPCSCYHFYQCEPLDGQWVDFHHRPCSDCTIWNQAKYTCDFDPEADLADCSHEAPPKENPYVDGGECTIGADRNKPLPSDKRAYARYTPASDSWTSMSCPPGTGFSLSQCKCVFGDHAASANPKMFCLNFENGFQTEGGYYVWPLNVGRVLGGLSGYAGSFDGTKSKIIIPYFTKNEIPAFTFSLWYKRTGTKTGSHGLVNNGDCMTDPSLQILSSGYNNVAAGINTKAKSLISSVQAIASGNVWHHVAMTYDGSTMTLYLDGRSVGSRSTSGHVLANECPLALGSQYDTGYFEGLMDEICYYSAALEAKEIAGLYNKFAVTND